MLTLTVGTFSPKKTTFGFKIPPQWSQGGTINSAIKEDSISTSPSGLEEGCALEPNPSQNEEFKFLNCC